MKLRTLKIEKQKRRYKMQSNKKKLLWARQQKGKSTSTQNLCLKSKNDMLKEENMKKVKYNDEMFN